MIGGEFRLNMTTEDLRQINMSEVMSVNITMMVMEKFRRIMMMAMGLRQKNMMATAIPESIKVDTMMNLHLPHMKSNPPNHISLICRTQLNAVRFLANSSQWEFVEMESPARFCTCVMLNQRKSIDDRP